MAYIGLISDTHGYFDEKMRRFLEPVDVVWHAGDFGDGLTMQEIAAFKPLVGVYGNCDGYDVRDYQPVMRFFEQDGMSVLMTHIGGYPRPAATTTAPCGSSKPTGPGFSCAATRIS